MNDDLKTLLDLQSIDLVIEKIQSRLEQIPVQIEALKAKIKEGQKAVEDEKQKFTQVQLGKKSKELEAGAQDEAISKHEKSLNSLKSNDAYKAMLGEIEAAKKKKSEIEDEILISMEEADRLVKTIKEVESKTKMDQQAIEGEIKTLEGEIQRLKADLDAELKKRNDFVPQVLPDLLSRYDYIRTKKKSQAIAVISGESCTGCNTNLTQNVINQVKKGKELIICESCSRILYFPFPETQAVTS